MVLGGMVFIWGVVVWLSVCGVLALNHAGKRNGLFWLAGTTALVAAAFCVVAGIDNARSERVDCHPYINPYTFEEETSCRIEHWLPEGVWRVINRY